MSAATLWEAYQEKSDPMAREKLLAHHLRLVHHVARKMVRMLSVEAELDDLISAGTIGLIKAIESFDPSRGLAFSTFAMPRIRGAILDDLRRWDHVPRSIRRKQRQIASVRESLRGELKRDPSPAETAAKLGIEVETYWRWQSDTQEAIHVSIHRPVEAEDGGVFTPLDVLVGDDGDGIEEDIAYSEEVELVRQQMMTLSERERLVLSLYYFEELKLHEIATILELTESRISQIRSKAIQKLRLSMSSLREQVA